MSEDHTHTHGTGEGQHTHEGWEPSRVIARMKREGWCAAQEDGGICMVPAARCDRHKEQA